MSVTDAPTLDSEEAWLAWRAEGIGASDVAKAFTGKYGGLYSVLAEKRGQQVEPDPDAQDRMQRGHDLEPVVAAMVELGTGWHVIGEQTWCEHTERPEWRCTLDGFIDPRPEVDLADAALTYEAKTYDVQGRPAWDYYRAQTQWQLLVTGFDRGILAVCPYDSVQDICHGPWIEVVHVDRLLQGQLMAAADEIAVHMAAGTWPDPDGSAHTAELIATIHSDPDATAQPVDLTSLDDDLARYAQLKSFTKKGGEIDQLGNRIKVAIGDATKGTGITHEAVWSVPRSKFDDEAFLVDHPQFAKPAVDLKAAETALGKEVLDTYRAPIGARSLTVRPLNQETE